MPESVFSCCPSARHAGRFDCLMSTEQPHSDNNEQWQGALCNGGSSARFPTKPTEKLKIGKMYAIKQNKICAEYRDMLPRPRLDLSGTPGLRPIGLSPGSWQTSLGLGSMSRYSAQILICIFYQQLIITHNIDYVNFVVGAASQNMILWTYRVQNNSWNRMRHLLCVNDHFKHSSHTPHKTLQVSTLDSPPEVQRSLVGRR